MTVWEESHSALDSSGAVCSRVPKAVAVLVFRFGCLLQFGMWAWISPVLVFPSSSEAPGPETTTPQQNNLQRGQTIGLRINDGKIITTSNFWFPVYTLSEFRDFLCISCKGLSSPTIRPPVAAFLSLLFLIWFSYCSVFASLYCNLPSRKCSLYPSQLLVCVFSTSKFKKKKNINVCPDVCQYDKIYLTILQLWDAERELIW